MEVSEICQYGDENVPKWRGRGEQCRLDADGLIFVLLSPSKIEKAGKQFLASFGSEEEASQMIDENEL